MLINCRFKYFIYSINVTYKTTNNEIYYSGQDSRVDFLKTNILNGKYTDFQVQILENRKTKKTINSLKH